MCLPVETMGILQHISQLGVDTILILVWQDDAQTWSEDNQSVAGHCIHSWVWCVSGLVDGIFALFEGCWKCQTFVYIH